MWTYEEDVRYARTSLVRGGHCSRIKEIDSDDSSSLFFSNGVILRCLFDDFVCDRSSSNDLRRRLLTRLRRVSRSREWTAG